MSEERDRIFSNFFKAFHQTCILNGYKLVRFHERDQLNPLPQNEIWWRKGAGIYGITSFILKVGKNQLLRVIPREETSSSRLFKYITEVLMDNNSKCCIGECSLDQTNHSYCPQCFYYYCKRCELKIRNQKQCPNCRFKKRNLREEFSDEVDDEKVDEYINESMASLLRQEIQEQQGEETNEDEGVEDAFNTIFQDILNHVGIEQISQMPNFQRHHISRDMTDEQIEESLRSLDIDISESLIITDDDELNERLTRIIRRMNNQ